MKKITITIALLLGFSLTTILFSCNNPDQKTSKKDNKKSKDSLQEYVAQRLPIYDRVKVNNQFE